MVRVDLMPQPAALAMREGRLTIGPSFRVALLSRQRWSVRDSRLESYVHRVLHRIEMRTGFEISREWCQDTASADLVIRSNSPGAHVPRLGEEEAYELDVSDRQAVLTASTAVGVLRGLETLLQLVACDGRAFYVPAVEIDDRPRFQWRGLLIDVCRHWMPLEVIKRNLDGMAAVKMNVLHLHLTDDQGFRIESRRFPRLHELGSDGQYYTQLQVTEIVQYARDRGIRVIPEFGMPAHVTSWLVGHPELGCVPGRHELACTYSVFDPVFDPTREEVYAFIDEFFREMTELFPDEYIHVGGDGHNGKQWTACPAVQDYMARSGATDVKAVHAHFNRRIESILNAHGKRMIGWEEILHPELPETITLQCWWTPASVVNTVRQRRPALMSFGYFLDHLRPAASLYAVDPLTSDTSVTEQEAATVLGGEACMWTEYVTPETIDSRIWPRLAAVAERLWSPAHVVDADDMYRRLARVSIRLEEHGLRHESHTAAMLRRIVDATDDEMPPLHTFVSLLEPVRWLRTMTQRSPVTRVVDAAKPDSFAARRVARLAQDVLSAWPDAGVNYDLLVQTFRHWQEIRSPVADLMSRSPLLAETRNLLDDLCDVAALGLEALSCLARQGVLSDEWHQTSVARLEDIGARKAELQLAVVPTVRLLVDETIRRCRREEAIAPQDVAGVPEPVSG